MNKLKQNYDYVRFLKNFNIYFSREVDHDVKNNEFAV